MIPYNPKIHGLCPKFPTKNRYATRALARAEIRTRVDAPKLYAYKCNECKGYHLSKKSREQDKKMKEQNEAHKTSDSGIRFKRAFRALMNGEGLPSNINLNQS